MFGEKNLGKCTMYTLTKVVSRFFCPAFSFSPVLYNATNAFGKSYLNSKLQVSER